jgi:hypothetical protein
MSTHVFCGTCVTQVTFSWCQISLLPSTERFLRPPYFYRWWCNSSRDCLKGVDVCKPGWRLCSGFGSDRQSAQEGPSCCSVTSRYPPAGIDHSPPQETTNNTVHGAGNNFPSSEVTPIILSKTSPDPRCSRLQQNQWRHRLNRLTARGKGKIIAQVEIRAKFEPPDWEMYRLRQYMSVGNLKSRSRKLNAYART